MGLLPPVILGALLIVAFAFSSQQRLALASHDGPLPARQTAYRMRVHHEAAIRLKRADPDLITVTDALNDNDDQFLSCIGDKTVATVMMIIGDETTLMPLVIAEVPETNAIVQELARQSIIAPELGRVGQTAWSVGYPGSSSALIPPVVGVGVMEGANIRTSSGLASASSVGCPAVTGVPVIVTQVLP